VTEQLDAGRRENKNLSLEIKDLLEQIGDGGRSLHEVEKQCRRLEEEKEELANALDEAEAALEQVLESILLDKLESSYCTAYSFNVFVLRKKKKTYNRVNRVITVRLTYWN
jgi:hypothetical protein